MSPVRQGEPSPSEWKVLRLVWESGPTTARELSERLAAPEGWTPSTVKTLLRRLVEKGHLRTRRAGGAFVYAPRRSPRKALFEAAEELLGRAREDTVGPLLAFLVQRSDLSAEDLAELRRLVEDEERRRRS